MLNPTRRRISWIMHTNQPENFTSLVLLYTCTHNTFLYLFYLSRAVSTIIIFNVLCKLLLLYTCKWLMFQPRKPSLEPEMHWNITDLYNNDNMRNTFRKKCGDCTTQKAKLVDCFSWFRAAEQLGQTVRFYVKWTPSYYTLLRGYTYSHMVTLKYFNQQWCTPLITTKIPTVL